MTTKKIFHSEHLIQVRCIAEFRNEYERKGLGVIIPVPNELAAKRRDIAICIGASDLIVVLNGKVLFCELKTAYNSQSPAQIAFQATVQALGFEYKIIRSLEEFKEYISLHL